jgi:hypothetical protein
MLRKRPKLLEFGIGGSRRVNEQLTTKRKGIELVFDAQAFELEGGANRHIHIQPEGAGLST